jgi:Skp family chaperone for outer membrane proteins
MSRLTLPPAALCAAVILAVSASSRAADMYKTVDPQGHVTYSDHPLSPSSQRVSVEVTPPNADEAARLTREQAALTAAAAQQTKNDRQDAADQAKKAAQLAQQQQRCSAARNRYALFAAGGRIFKTDADGNRVYYSDEEIDQQRTLTKAAMESACNY